MASTKLLYSQCWDEQCAIYHVESGDTHLLDTANLAILELIGNQPITLGEIQSAGKGYIDIDIDIDIDSYIKILVLSFEELGLIDAVFDRGTVA